MVILNLPSERVFAQKTGVLKAAHAAMVLPPDMGTG